MRPPLSMHGFRWPCIDLMQSKENGVQVKETRHALARVAIYNRWGSEGLVYQEEGIGWSTKGCGAGPPLIPAQCQG